MAQTWLLLRSPSNKSGDPPHAINSWIDIISGLRKQNVDISKIDTKLYYELTTVLEGEALRRRIAEIAMWSRTGHLDKRYAVWCKYVEGTREKKTKVTRTQHTVTPVSRKEKDTRTGKISQWLHYSEWGAWAWEGHVTVTLISFFPFPRRSQR
jgi:hypothetical protein